MLYFNAMSIIYKKGQDTCHLTPYKEVSQSEPGELWIIQVCIFVKSKSKTLLTACIDFNY